ncbi:translation regulatory protein [Ochrobactrum phage vB_OspM_OC]|nr:translation regulatory protein [Ochrobactrum phage vB_OspM_OC]
MSSEINFVEITLKSPDDFLKVKETLTRMGVASSKEKKLYQSCHILHKKGKFFIVHFKELFLLDGRESTLAKSDIARRNTIISLLEQWGLIEVVDKNLIEEPRAKMDKIVIVKFSDRENWELIHKYKVGRKKKPETE